MPWVMKCDDCADAFSAKGGLESGRFCGYMLADDGPYPIDQKCPSCDDPNTNLKRWKKMSQEKLVAFSKEEKLGGVRTQKHYEKKQGLGRGRKLTYGSYNDNKKFDDLGVSASKEEQQDDVRALDDSNDPEFEPTKNFSPAMRYTTAGYAARIRQANLYDAKCEMGGKAWKISGAADRLTSTSVAMAAALKATINSRPQISAYSWINWNATAKRGKPFKISPHESFEWCHLVADCLGGPTVHTNLVAASYAANTFMLVIEQKLQSRTELAITVTVDCSSDYVAEFIHYEVFKKGASKTWLIDGRANGFSAADGKLYADEVAYFLK